MSTPIKVPLSQGLFALIDVADEELVLRHKWHATRNGNLIYAATNVPRESGGYRRLYMHRLILGEPTSPSQRLVDHRNHDGLDNQRGNLRWSSALQNNLNSRLKRDPSMRGVYAQGSKWWVVKLRRAGVVHYGGCFTDVATAKDAAAALAARLFADEAPFVATRSL